jgi:transcriptional regulator with XRE-family HTH domain
MIVKSHEWTNEKVAGQLEEFPYFTVKCNLAEVLDQRGLQMAELAELTGLRKATLSELANLKRSTISLPHLIVVAKALRITDINELIEFTMPPETRETFEEDQKYIEKNGLLQSQDEILSWIRYEKRLIKNFKKIVRKWEKEQKKKAEEEAKAKENEAKEKPTSD